MNYFWNKKNLYTWFRFHFIALANQRTLFAALCICIIVFNLFISMSYKLDFHVLRDIDTNLAEEKFYSIICQKFYRRHIILNYNNRKASEYVENVLYWIRIGFKSKQSVENISNWTQHTLTT